MKSAEQPINEPCGLTFVQLMRLADEKVMAHVQAGHDDALAVLFDRYHRLVLSVAFKILRDVGEAEDVTQMVFLEIYKVAAQFDASRGTTKAWLLQYAYHRSMNRRQYLKRRRFYDQDLGGAGDSNAAADPPSHAGPGLMALPEVRSLIREGLESLNLQQRRALEMAYFEGMSLKDIADATGESLGNVRHHYYRGLHRLRLFVSNGSSTVNSRRRPELVRRGTVDVEA